jgi:hypothetical protein
MDDYPGLAARVAAGVGGLRGCLILSRHGLVLGAHPDGDERVAKPTWLRFALLGEPERAFVEFADQIWVYVHRGPYAAFAIADAGVRPGLLIDRLEQALLMAEESRTRRDGLRAPDTAATPAAGLRTPLHPAAPTGDDADVPVIVPAAAGRQRPTAPAAPAAPAGGGDRSRDETPSSAGPSDRPPGESAAQPEPAPTSPTKREPPKLMTTPPAPARKTTPEDEAEVDKVMLAQEFGGLLQDLGSDDEATS